MRDSPDGSGASTTNRLVDDDTARPPTCLAAVNPEVDGGIATNSNSTRAAAAVLLQQERQHVRLFLLPITIIVAVFVTFVYVCEVPTGWHRVFDVDKKANPEDPSPKATSTTRVIHVKTERGVVLTEIER